MIADRLPDSIESAIGRVHAVGCDDWDDEGDRCGPLRDLLRREVLAGMLEAKADGHNIGWEAAVADEMTGQEDADERWRARAKAIREGR